MLVIGVTLVPNAHAQTYVDIQAQYQSAVQQLITLLTQEIASLEAQIQQILAQQAVDASATAAITGTSTPVATSTYVPSATYQAIQQVAPIVENIPTSTPPAATSTPTSSLPTAAPVTPPNIPPMPQLIITGHPVCILNGVTMPCDQYHALGY